MLIFDVPDNPFTTPDAGHPRRLIFDKPLKILQAHDLASVRPVLRAAEAATLRGLYAAGFVSYEAAPAFDPAHEVRTGGTLPLAWFGLYAAPRPSSPGQTPAGAGRDGRPRLTGQADSSPFSQRVLAALAALDDHLGPRLAHDPERGAAVSVPTMPVHDTWPALQPAIDRATYDAAVAHIREAIARGDVYQVNYTFPLRGTAPTDALALYEDIAQAGHGGYSAYLDIGSHRLLSFSPELFFARDGDRVRCRPMKGTVARGRWPEEDQARAHWLATSEKNRAENVMIVDLVRNDLGRVARTGSVHVPALFAIERYPTVWQMTSTIDAELRPGTTLDALFGALFPCGSITGAPKISAMHQIAALESAPRGIYCGAIGLLSPAHRAPGQCLFNVAIRTLTIDTARQTADYRVGGGVTWDSDSREEYAEALAKAALLQPHPPFSLIETMRIDRGAIPRLERHLARLTASARYFDFALSAGDEFTRRLRERLLGEAAAHPHGLWRLRLLCSSAGQTDVTVQAIPAGEPSAAPDAPDALDAPNAHSASLHVHAPIVVMTDRPVDAEDPFLCHKTTRRDEYNARRAEWPAAFDVLLWNHRGEITEFTIGNIVVELDGALVTPTRSSGLLTGTFRQQLLDAGTISERILTRDDVQRASRMWLINSVREWVPVRLQQTDPQLRMF